MFNLYFFIIWIDCFFQIGKSRPLIYWPAVHKKEEEEDEKKQFQSVIQIKYRKCPLMYK